MVLAHSTGDRHIIRRADIKAVSIVPARTIASGVIDRHARDGQTIHSIDADSLNRRVGDFQVGDRGIGQVMGVEELGLGLAAVASLAIPPAGAIGIENGTAGAGDLDAAAFDLQERASPLFVAPGRCALEDDLSWR